MSDDNWLVPADNNTMAVSEQMKKDAQATAGATEPGAPQLPFLYLAQPDAKVVVERRACAGGDFVVLKGEDDTPIGPSAKFIVMGHHVRFKYQVERIDGKKKMLDTVWDAARDFMTPAQAEQADLRDWNNPRKAKPYSSFLLVHVGDGKIDPHGLGFIRFRTDGMAAKAGRALSDAVENKRIRGVPIFAQVWEFSAKLEENSHGGSKFVPHTKYAATVDSGRDEYAKLREIWEQSKAFHERLRADVYGQDAELAAAADAAKVADVPKASGKSPYEEYATSVGGDDNDSEIPF